MGVVIYEMLTGLPPFYKENEDVSTLLLMYTVALLMIEGDDDATTTTLTLTPSRSLRVAAFGCVWLRVRMSLRSTQHLTGFVG